MNVFVKFSVTVIFIWLLFFGQGFSQDKELIFNTQEFAPFNYCINQIVSGPIAEIIKTVCMKIPINYSFKSLPWRRAQYEVENGKANALFVLAKTKDREEWLYFSPPIVESEYGIFVHKNNMLQYEQASDLKGYLIGVYEPSGTSKSLEELINQTQNITIDMTPDDIAGFKKLEMERIKAVYSNKDVGNFLINQFDLKNIRYAGTHKKVVYYIGFSKQYTDIGIVDEFNAIFMELYHDGTIEKILNQYQMKPAVIQ